MSKRGRTLPEPWAGAYAERRASIQQRLNEFAEIPAEDYFYELAFCVLTPQSSARNAMLVIGELVERDFLGTGFDPTAHLRDPSHYIRFHNTKARRLLAVRERFGELLPVLTDHALTAPEKREAVRAMVSGMGMKEASHFLRNIGVRGLAILDRHIYKHLARLDVIAEPPTSGPTTKRYLEIEQAWHAYAAEVGIPLDELDLLFWSMETGEILK